MALRLHMMGAAYGQRPSSYLPEVTDPWEQMNIDWLALMAGLEDAQRRASNGELIVGAVKLA